MLTTEEAAKMIAENCRNSCDKINEFSRIILRTRGGRIGSGMGTLLEALWGYYINQLLSSNATDSDTCELAWLYGHEYNDFACVQRGEEWDPDRRMGELLRIEVKSMNTEADESKAHFSELVNDLAPNDLLLILVWNWFALDEYHVCPHIVDFFIDYARDVAALRDSLHVARGGTFVNRTSCPDGCSIETCRHHGEPLNAEGKRERASGPETARVSQKVSYAANFGGLVRMLKTNSESARIEFRRIRADSDVAHRYISFIHRNYPSEEMNQYKLAEWNRIARNLEIPVANVQLDEMIRNIREKDPNYMDTLRSMTNPVFQR